MLSSLPCPTPRVLAEYSHAKWVVTSDNQRLVSGIVNTTFANSICTTIGQSECGEGVDCPSACSGGGAATGMVERGAGRRLLRQPACCSCCSCCSCPCPCPCQGGGWSSLCTGQATVLCCPQPLGFSAGSHGTGYFSPLRSLRLPLRPACQLCARLLLLRHQVRGQVCVPQQVSARVPGLGALAWYPPLPLSQCPLLRCARAGCCCPAAKPP